MNPRDAGERPGVGTDVAVKAGSISAIFIKRPIATSLLAIAIMLIGLAAFPLLPVAPLPQVEFPTISVSAALPGANPDTMASNVATPLEKQFSAIPGLTQMSSSSSLGATSINLTFDLDRDIDSAAQDVQAAISAAGGQLPQMPNPPSYRKVNPGDAPIMIVSLSSDVFPLTQVSDFTETIFAQALSQVNGVGGVTIFGSQRPAIRVQVDPARLAATGLDLETVRSQVAIASTNAPKGSLDSTRQTMTVYNDDQIFDIGTWNDVVLAYRNGAPIRVRDIGQAVNGPENTRVTSFAYGGPAAPEALKKFDHTPAMVIGINKLPGANVIEVSDRVKELLPRLQAALPPAVEVNTFADRTMTITASVNDVEFTLVLTVLLVVMVIYIFLRNVAATVIPSVTIPLALLGTCAIMYVAKFSLDNISLMALTIAVGFVVDDAIVMLENIYHYVERGEDPKAAALKGSAEISFTIISISVSLIAVFIPILLMGGIIGRVMREFAYTVAIMVAVSVVLTLTLTPMLCAQFLKAPRGDEKHGRLFTMFEDGFARMLAAYGRGLRFVLNHQRQTLASFVLTVIATVLLFVFIPKGFFPQQDTRSMIAVVEGPQDKSTRGMMQALTDVGNIIKHDPDVMDFATYQGGGGSNTGNLFINLKPKSGDTTPADQVIGRLRPQLGRVMGVNTFIQVSQDLNFGARPTRTQYQYTLIDADLKELYEWAPRVTERLRREPLLADVASDQQNGALSVNLTIDRDAAARFGIQPSLIDATLYDAIGQRQVGQYFTQVNSYRIILEVTPELQGDPALFDKLFITSPRTGGQVPLSSLVKIDTTKPSYLSVAHQGQFPAVTISFNLARGASLGDAVKAVEAAQQEMGVPATMRGSFQGTAQAFQASLRTQPYLIAAALIAVYIILGVLYESYIHPLTILSTLPSAGVGALVVLWAFGFDLSVIALIGILLLIGIVKKNGIMMVDFAIQAEREQGLAPEDAIYQACMRRFRPIMMTTMCAMLAGVPLALGHGTGSELRRPLGAAIVGGLILSQMLTLFTTPVIYLYLDRLGIRMRERRNRAIEAQSSFT